MLAALSVRNNVQPRVAAHPVDFIAMRFPGSPPDDDAIWLYGDENHQAIIQSKLTDGALHFRYVPVRGLRQDSDGSVHFEPAQLEAGFPLRIWEDPNLPLPAGQRTAWLCAWHSEIDWLRAIHKTRYSNGVIALHEQFLRESPSLNLSGDAALLGRFNARRRRLAEPDFLIFANDHWNFNVRGFNPGGKSRLAAAHLDAFGTHAGRWRGSRNPPATSDRGTLRQLEFCPYDPGSDGPAAGSGPDARQANPRTPAVI